MNKWYTQPPPTILTIITRDILLTWIAIQGSTFLKKKMFVPRKHDRQCTEVNSQKVEQKIYAKWVEF